MIYALMAYGSKVWFERNSIYMYVCVHIYIYIKKYFIYNFSKHATYSVDNINLKKGLPDKL